MEGQHTAYQLYVLLIEKISILNLFIYYEAFVESKLLYDCQSLRRLDAESSQYKIFNINATLRRRLLILSKKHVLQT